MKSILSVIAICVFAPAASQASMFKKEIHINVTPNVPAKCTDFSGNWKGNCAITGPDGKVQNYDMSVKMDQDKCSRLFTDSGLFEIGSIEGETHADYASVRAFDWNADATQLNAIETGIAADSTVSSGSSDVVVTGHHIVSIQAVLKLDNGKMVVDQAGDGFKGVCTLDKQ